MRNFQQFQMRPTATFEEFQNNAVDLTASDRTTFGREGSAGKIWRHPDGFIYLNAMNPYSVLEACPVNGGVCWFLVNGGWVDEYEIDGLTDEYAHDLN